MAKGNLFKTLATNYYSTRLQIIFSQSSQAQSCRASVGHSALCLLLLESTSSANKTLQISQFVCALKKKQLSHNVRLCRHHAEDVLPRFGSSAVLTSSESIIFCREEKKSKNPERYLCTHQFWNHRRKATRAIQQPHHLLNSPKSGLTTSFPIHQIGYCRNWVVLVRHA